jgi:hypothetical protein
VRQVPAPATDPAAFCADVADGRICWGEGPAAVIVATRVLPAQAAPARGWRCSGNGPARRCEDRAWGSAPFACGEDGCTQAHPRMPDDGEWECAEIEGVVLCHGGAPAAGVVPGPEDPGWLCGARKRHPGERVCVDFSPDRPPGKLGDCRFEHGPGRTRRVCRPGPEPGVGRRCSEGGCPAGAVCAGERCWPLRPAPECWLDADCERGACLLGSCPSAQSR